MTDANWFAANAKDIDTQAAIWLERRDDQAWSAQDQTALDAWLAEALAHRVAYWRIKAAWGRADRLVVLRSAVSDAPAPRGRFIPPVLLKIAAVFVVVAVAGALAANMLTRPKDRVFTTPIGGHEIVRFADGSQVELNTDTILRARMTTDQRVIWLEKGEAYFQVKHDALHPLIVMVDNHRVTDLGTKFLVRHDTARLEVAVLEGRVWFDVPDGRMQPPSLPLAPGQVAIASGRNVSVERKSMRTLTNELGWRRGVLVFRDTTLADAAAEFNRYNRQKLSVPDPAVGFIKIGGIFEATNVGAFTEVAEDVLGLRVKDHGSEIVISR
ncbi:MAG TPA: FecR domain-containing protein [Rhizomicrobium sp.]|nr:FecR domain-containing protein [Rhizomicrobium sp.]